MRKTLILLIIAIILTTIPTGCYDRREVDDMAYVVAIGFDKGVTDKLRLTLQFVTFKGGGGMAGGTGSSGLGGGNELGIVGETAVVTVDCPSFFTGLNIANISTSRQFNLMHTKLLIYSEELARSGEISKYVSAIVRYRQIRKIMHLIVTKGQAADLINENRTLVGKIPPKAMDLVMTQSDYTGFFPQVRLFDFYNSFKSTMEQPIAILANVNTFANFKKPGQGEMQESISGGEYLAGELPRKNGIKREYFGAAVFHGGKMVGEINGSEVRILKIIQGKFKRGFFTMQDPLAPNYIVPLDVRLRKRPQIKVKTQGNVPEIYVWIPLEGNILAIQSGEQYEELRLKSILEQAFEQDIKDQADSLIEKCQNQFESDIFGFGRHTVYFFPTIKEWESYKWHEKFPLAKITTEVDFHIRGTGMMLKTSPITEQQGKDQ